MAYDMSAVFCNNVTYNVPGFDWAVAPGDFQAFNAQGTCHLSGMAWVSVPEPVFNLILSDAQSGGSSGSSGTSGFTSEEIAALKYQAANPNPFNLSISEGGALSVAIVTLWALAWGIRSVTKTINHDGGE